MNMRTLVGLAIVATIGCGGDSDECKREWDRVADLIYSVPTVCPNADTAALEEALERVASSDKGRSEAILQLMLVESGDDEQCRRACSRAVGGATAAQRACRN